MNRKQKRAMKKHLTKDVNEKLSQKISQFGNLPEQCSTCSETFDKLDKDMVKSWSVVVKQEVVRLFCPKCINKAKEVIQNAKNTKNQ